MWTSFRLVLARSMKYIEWESMIIAAAACLALTVFINTIAEARIEIECIRATKNVEMCSERHK